ncbi:MAG: site-specific integrase [Coriobacteriales bacterium]|jgi:integrase|nr:site-specific integrase [Coriobacteriales bacterium]
MKIKGNGSIKQVRNKKGEVVKNSWQLVLSLGNDPLTGKRAQKYRGFKGTKTQARRALEEFRREVESGLKLDADKMTFGAYARQWHESRKAAGNLADSTLRRDRDVLKHLLLYLEAVPMADIDAVTVRNFYTTLAQGGIGQHTLSKVAVVLKQILKQAVNDDIILRNPCDRVDAPKAPKSKKASSLDREGFERMVDAIKEAETKEYPLASTGQQFASNMAHAAATRLALMGGFRRGEVLALSWRDVNFGRNEIEVNKSLCKETNKPKTPKTDASNRTVSFGADTMASLRRWKEYQAKYLLGLGIEQDDNTPVITGTAGSRIHMSNFDRWWRTFRKRYEFGSLRFHDLRHTHATMLISSNQVSIKAVSARLGHASIQITLDLYGHAMREDDVRCGEVIEFMTTKRPIMQVVNL